MFIHIDCYDMESKVKYKAYIQVDNIISIEPECFQDLNEPYFDDTCSIIYLCADYYLHSYLSPDEVMKAIHEAKSAEAQAALQNTPFFGGKKK